MKRRILILVALAAIVGPVQAQAVSDADKSQLQSVITHQLEAFKRSDADAAYSDAAPLIHKIFPSVETFMTMVARGYMPVYRNTKYSFGASATDSLGRPSQEVLIIGTDGKSYTATYFMERQPDGSWKVAGVALRENPGVDA